MNQPRLHFGIHRQFAIERIIHGHLVESALREEVERYGTLRAFVVTTAREADSAGLQRVVAGLGTAFAGTYTGVSAHVPLECVLAGARAARDAGADLLIAFGGGSVIDATKAMLLCLWNGASAVDEFRRLRTFKGVDPSKWSPLPSLRMVAVPTLLSAAELTWFAGVTDMERRVKEGYGHAGMIPRTVIYDPSVTQGVPLHHFLASGMKAVDHAAERLASNEGQSYSDAMSAEALRLLSLSLPAVLLDPTDLDARLQCQIAAWLSIAGANSGVGVGASHALGHVLGAHTGLTHGLTSCVCLPAVMRWNRSVNAAKQSLVSTALGRSGVDASQAILELIESLGLPTRLRDVGVKREDFSAVATKAFVDPPMQTNPRRPTSAEELLEVLESAW